jgi:hypothetical protein
MLRGASGNEAADDRCALLRSSYATLVERSVRTVKVQTLMQVTFTLTILTRPED